MTDIYGLPNCDTTKKALAWLKKNNIEFQFHDYKKEGADKAKLKEWMAADEKKILLNKAGTTWKGISPEEQAKANTQAGAIKLMTEHTSMIKRPVIETSGTILIGFKEDAYAKAFLNKK
jgi:arsenate reductase